MQVTYWRGFLRVLVHGKYGKPTVSSTHCHQPDPTTQVRRLHHYFSVITKAVVPDTEEVPTEQSDEPPSHKHDIASPTSQRQLAPNEVIAPKSPPAPHPPPANAASVTLSF
jgi:hypothetical protein